MFVWTYLRHSQVFPAEPTGGIVMKSFKRLLAASAATIAVATMPSAASAAVLVYHATNYEAGPGKHGLWTNTYNTGADRFYAFQSDMIFTVDTDTGTATMTGTAINPSDAVAEINLSFDGFLESTFGSSFAYKQESGGAYNAEFDTLDVDFFTAASGSITIDGEQLDLRANPFASNYAFQYGTGANAKNGAFGGSSWLRLEDQNGHDLAHWDINFNLTAVPEPATWAMMIIGFGAVGGSLRRKKSQKTLSFA